MKALVLLGFSNTPSPQTISMKLIQSAALPTSATVSKVIISPVPCCTVIAAIDEPANCGRHQRALIQLQLRQITCGKFELCAKDELKPLVSFKKEAA